MADAQEKAVYETAEPGDADYADPQPPPPQYESEFISSEEIDANQARNVFNRFEADTKNTNYASLRQRGFRSGQRAETNAEKLARISRELEELRHEEIDVDDLDLAANQLKTRLRISQKPAVDAVILPRQDQSASSEKLSLLESRLATLESRLGSHSGHNIASEVDLLRIKLNALTNSEDLQSTIIPRLQAFNEEIAALSDTPQLVTRIEELHTAVNVVRDLGPRVPLILDRLRSLHKVHENAAESHERLQAVRTALSARATELGEWRSNLDAIETGLKTFNQISAQNSEALLAQNQALLQRLDKIQTEAA